MMYTKFGVSSSEIIALTTRLSMLISDHFVESGTPRFASSQI